jgi:hypothetical protein
MRPEKLLMAGFDEFLQFCEERNLLVLGFERHYCVVDSLSIKRK